MVARFQWPNLPLFRVLLYPPLTSFSSRMELLPLIFPPPSLKKKKKRCFLSNTVKYCCIQTIYRHTLLEKAMAPHSSALAWKIPWTEEPGRLQSMGSLRVGHDWTTSLSLFTFLHWRQKWQPTPVFLPGVSQGRGSLVGRRLWGRTESDTTEVT